MYTVKDEISYLKVCLTLILKVNRSSQVVSLVYVIVSSSSVTPIQCLIQHHDRICIILLPVLEKVIQ